jgi:hypothetical protein
MINPEFLKIFACPKCKGDLELASDGQGLICWECQLKYPFEGSIPIMLIDKAISLEKENSKK